LTCIIAAKVVEALAAYHAALQVWTRERSPLPLAMAQNNIGNALWSLGERQSGTARLEEAVAAHRAALLERLVAQLKIIWIRYHVTANRWRVGAAKPTC
jgi:hypothetical protein